MMKKAFFLLLTCCIFTAQSSCSKGQADKKNAALNVLSVAGMNLRQEPSTTSKVLALVPYGAKVSIEETTDKTQEIDNFKGRFVKATYNGKTGYLFDGFLAALPAPDLKKSANLDGYAAKYLGKGTKKSEKITAYPNDVIHEVQSGEGSYAQKLTVPNITLAEGFLLARALASTLDAGFTGREAFPKKNATYEETFKGAKIQSEVRINNIEGTTFYEISKTRDGHIFMISVGLTGKNKVRITFASAD